MVLPENGGFVKSVPNEINTLKHFVADGDGKRISSDFFSSVAHVENEIRKPVFQDARIHFAMGSGKIGFREC